MLRGDSSENEDTEIGDFEERHPRAIARGRVAVPAIEGKIIRKRNGEVVKPIRRVGPMRDRRRASLYRGVRGLGFDGRGTVGMSITYHEGPIAQRLTRKCNKQRNLNFKSGVKLDPDIEADRARVRALALTEEVRLEKQEAESEREINIITEIVVEECRDHGITINAEEAVVKRVVEAASAIALGTHAIRRKWMRSIPGARWTSFRNASSSPKRLRWLNG